jgi:anti-anti-sigma factor
MSDPTPDLTITRDGIRIAIVGDIRTAADRDLLRECVVATIAELQSEKPELVLDVTRTRYLDAGALVVLVTIARKCIDHGLTLALEGADPELLELLRVTKIDQVLGYHGARVTPARPAA